MDTYESYSPNTSKYTESWISFLFMHRPSTINAPITKGTLALFGNIILIMFLIAFITCLIYKYKIGITSFAELKKKNFVLTQFDNVYNNWIQTMIMFLGLDIAGAISSFLVAGSIDWWSICVCGAARNLIFLLFNIFKVYYLQATALAA
jgi:hypothetical protein